MTDEPPLSSDPAHQPDDEQHHEDQDQETDADVHGIGVPQHPPSAQALSDQLWPPREANLEGLVLLLHALGAEGRDVIVIDRSWFTKNAAAGRMSDLDGVDYVVVEDATWQAWCEQLPASWPAPGGGRTVNRSTGIE